MIAHISPAGTAPFSGGVKVQSKAPNVDKKMFDRPNPYNERREMQFKAHPKVCL